MSAKAAPAATEPVRKDFLPFSRPTIGDEEIAEVADSMRSGWLTTGPKTQRFAEKFKAYVGAKFAQPLNSATAGLHVALLAAGLKEGDEVLTTPMTFAATANTVLHAGAKVVFADIDLSTLNLSLSAAREKAGARTRVILPVHFAGLPVDLDGFKDLARQNGALLIEDAAHAAGTAYKGRLVGAFGDMTVFSFHPNKNMTTGEGGMVTFDAEHWAQPLQLLSFHGMDKNAWKRYTPGGTPHYDIALPGFKYNMLDLQAAIGLHQLDKLEGFIKRRTELAEFYLRSFADVEELGLPGRPAYEHRHAWHIFTPLVKTEKLSIDRDRFIDELKAEGVGSGIHYTAVHLNSCYQALGFRRGQFPNAEYASDRILSLPLFPLMSDRDAEDVVKAVKKVIARSLK